MKNLIIAIFLIVFMYGCGTGRIRTTDTKPNEAIVFGKLSIVGNNKPLKNKKLLLHFNERLWAKNAVTPDSEGYFYMKLPVKDNFLALIEYRDGGFYKNIPDNYISVNLTEDNKIYYIGDIQIEWEMSDNDKRKNMGFAGVIIDAKEKGINLPVKVEFSEETLNYFNKLFPNNNKEIIKKPVLIDKH